MDPFSTGVLDKEVHDRLVAGIDQFARDAGIDERFIYTPLPEQVSVAEREWLRRFQYNVAEGHVAGLCYTAGSTVADITQRMAFVTGCLVRNFVRARMMPLGDLVDALSARTLPRLDCVLVPNFFYASVEGGYMAKWQVSMLHDFLVASRMERRQVVLYVDDLSMMGQEYGASMTELVQGSFVLVGGA